MCIFASIIHGIYLHQLGNYLKNQHPRKWSEIQPKSFFGLSQDILESRNYITELKFVFLSDHLNDEKVKKLKYKIRLFLLLSLIMLIFSLISFLINY